MQSTLLCQLYQLLKALPIARLRLPQSYIYFLMMLLNGKKHLPSLVWILFLQSNEKKVAVSQLLARVNGDSRNLVFLGALHHTLLPSGILYAETIIKSKQTWLIKWQQTQRKSKEKASANDVVVVVVVLAQLIYTANWNWMRYDDRAQMKRCTDWLANSNLECKEKNLRELSAVKKLHHLPVVCVWVKRLQTNWRLIIE